MFFNVLQRSSTWLIICLISIYLSSCSHDGQVTPSVAKTEQLSSEISEIKSWFEYNAHASGLVNCNVERSYIPRWDRSKDGGDRIEFDTWVNAENKICLPKVAGTGLQSGRIKFVAKKRNGNGNGNGNMQGVIVSFIPFQNFTGDITKVSTTTFRQMQFSGIIAFEEVNGCLGNAYLIDQGIVKTKLTIQSPNQITPRCGEAYITTHDYYTRFTMPGRPDLGCTVNFAYSSQSTIYGAPCLDAPVSVGSGGNYGSSSASSSDATYNGYLAPPVVNSFCMSTLASGFAGKYATAGINYSTHNTLPDGANVVITGFTFSNLQISSNSNITFAYLDINVTCLASLYDFNTNINAGATQPANTVSANAIATLVNSAYSSARGTFFLSNVQGTDQDFANEWMLQFNRRTNSQTYGRYDLTITINKGGNPDNIAVLDATSPTCQ